MRHPLRVLAILFAIGVCGISAAQAQALPNSRWYQFNDSETVFVFVHGIFSDSEGCWKAANGTFWPDLVKADDRFDHPSVYLGGYYTDFASGIYRVRDAANDLLSNMGQADAEARRRLDERRDDLSAAEWA